MGYIFVKVLNFDKGVTPRVLPIPIGSVCFYFELELEAPAIGRTGLRPNKLR